MLESIQLHRIFVEYPLFFYAFISKYYPLTEPHLSFLEEELFWGLVALNEKMDFSIDLIEKYSEKLNKDDLSYNKKVNDSGDIMDYFHLKPRSFWQKLYGDEDDIDGGEKNDRYHPSVRYHEYSPEEIEENKNSIQWNHFSSNDLIDWNYDLIYRYKDYLWFGIQEAPNSYTTDGLELYNNESVPWDVNLIQLFADRIFNHRRKVEQFIFNETMVSSIKPLVDENLFLQILCELKF